MKDAVEAIASTAAAMLLLLIVGVGLGATAGGAVWAFCYASGLCQ